MAISYAAIKNHHARVTMPTVENGWYLTSNIQKDPPKSIHTRRKDRVGDTMAINNMIEESPDRQCEAINYYARGVNPMVSVDYGQGQTGSGTGCAGSQAYLPYRIAREGAFRPPVLEGIKNLLPLSRLPRILTTVCATPYLPIFTKRMRNCGTTEQTREVHNDILRTSCMTQKLIQAYPQLNEPITKLNIRNDTQPIENVRSRPSCPTSFTEIQQRLNQPPLYLPSTRQATSITSNIAGQNENIHTYESIHLPPTRQATSATSNITGQNENVHTYESVYLPPTRQSTSITSNQSMGNCGTGDVINQEYLRLHDRADRGGIEGYKQIPKTLDRPIKILDSRRPEVGFINTTFNRGFVERV